jgi:hypothetical protein
MLGKPFFGTHKLYDYLKKKENNYIQRDSKFNSKRKKKEGFGVKNKLRFPPQCIV